MALINDLKTWQGYCHYKQILSNDWREKENIPNDFQPFYENALSISDLSHDLVKSILFCHARFITGVYDIDKDNQKTIDLIVQYIRQDEAFLKANPSYSFKKGLLIHGSVGTGKTTIFKALRSMIANISFYNPTKEYPYLSCLAGCFEIVSANEIVRRFSIKGNEIFTANNAEIINKATCLDDVGTETEAAYYGQKTNIIAEILQERYEKGTLTHISSNLNATAFKDAYGLRVYDRMRSMFNDIPLTGNSRRK